MEMKKTQVKQLMDSTGELFHNFCCQFNDEITEEYQSLNRCDIPFPSYAFIIFLNAQDETLNSTTTELRPKATPVKMRSK